MPTKLDELLPQMTIAQKNYYDGLRSEQEYISEMYQLCAQMANAILSQPVAA